MAAEGIYGHNGMDSTHLSFMLNEQQRRVFHEPPRVVARGITADTPSDKSNPWESTWVSDVENRLAGVVKGVISEVLHVLPDPVIQEAFRCLNNSISAYK